MMQHGRAEIRPQVAAVAPDGAIVHQAIFEKHLLPGTNVVAGENDVTRCINCAFRYGRRILVGLEGQKKQNAQAENKHDKDGTSPPRGELLNRLG